MTNPERKSTMIQLEKLTAVARGIMEVELRKIGMWISGIHFYLGSALCASQIRRGKTTPARKNQFTFEYLSRFPKILLSPTKPQMTEALKKTLSIRHIYWLFDRSNSVSQGL
ncbi:hypothetical protein Nepgr_020147 [Nepenthes gracilis]|uniref:Uncharacterized protein n=1 Tax=Nepenthes gracilis TaxID=150966 RepID=A0AAD3SYK1_NEPGR|nr:hypothetical protein Nepgr_020147 [Nepenthes gracilis]